jgi:uncharacterized protein (TIGR02391 family)
MKGDVVRVLKQGELERIAKILGDGLTGTEIGYLLGSVQIPDTDPNNTKWKRLYNAFVQTHNQRGSSNHVLSFIAKALEPARFVGDSRRYQLFMDHINKVLAFHGLAFREDGKFHTVSKATTLSEAEARAQTLRDTVADRNLHPALLDFCKSELLENNYFHAVLEACKGVAEMIRRKTGLVSDSSELVDAALGGSEPVLRINSSVTDTDKSEQRGFVNLLKGLFGTFRNPTAHAPRVAWNMSEQDALDLFALASYAFRRIDAATKRSP